MTSVLRKGEKCHRWGEHHVRTDAETRATLLQAKDTKDPWPPPEAQEKQGRMPPRVSEGAGLAEALIGTSTLQNCERKLLLLKPPTM